MSDKRDYTKVIWNKIEEIIERYNGKIPDSSKMIEEILAELNVNITIAHHAPDVGALVEAVGAYTNHRDSFPHEIPMTFKKWIEIKGELYNNLKAKLADYQAAK